MSGPRERPILMSAPMVRAILAGTKTQTRRIVKITHRTPGLAACLEPADPSWVRPKVAAELCPYGAPGDRLWVRETWAEVGTLDPGIIVYRADYPACVPAGVQNIPDASDLRWTPSIHMPRAASRITLEVTDVRVERLQDISQADAMAEGAPPSHPSIDIVSREYGYEDFSRSWYAQLWEEINGAGSWAANPWVWVVCFQRSPHTGEPRP